jgi:hypothetical protein
MPTYTVRVEKYVQHSFEVELESANAEEAMHEALEQARLDPGLFEQEDAESAPRIYSILNQENGAEITLPDLEDNMAFDSCLTEFAAKVESAVGMEPSHFEPAE